MTIRQIAAAQDWRIPGQIVHLLLLLFYPSPGATIDLLLSQGILPGQSRTPALMLDWVTPAMKTAK